MSSKHPFPDYAEIRTNIERARAERAAYLGELISGAAATFARRVASYTARLRAGRRRAAQPADTAAHKALRRWAGIH